MTISVEEAIQKLEGRGMLIRRARNQSEKIIELASELIGHRPPTDLVDFYRANVAEVGEYFATTPVWNQRVGWIKRDWVMDRLLPLQAIPIFDDGCGSLFGVDISTDNDHPAVYFFDHETRLEGVDYAAGSSIGAFLLLLAEQSATFGQHRPPGWQLKIDPDIDKCARAPPIWLAG